MKIVYMYTNKFCSKELQFCLNNLDFSPVFFTFTEKQLCIIQYAVTYTIKGETSSGHFVTSLSTRWPPYLVCKY